MCGEAMHLDYPSPAMRVPRDNLRQNWAGRIDARKVWALKSVGSIPQRDTLWTDHARMGGCVSAVISLFSSKWSESIGRSRRAGLNDTRAKHVCLLLAVRDWTGVIGRRARFALAAGDGKVCDGRRMKNVHGGVSRVLSG